MKRLVYSPKAFAYVITRNEGAINLSDYIVSGDVHRKVDQVSTATLTIRNPHRMFTKPGHPTFMPMDRITIFLQRLPGAPVQTFTGYLDSTPYYQMYPGTCTLSASCTLKRLLHTYFDPGVPFMMHFLKKYNWIPTENGIMKAGPAKSTKKAALSSGEGRIWFFGDSLSVGTETAAGNVFGKKWQISGNNAVSRTTAQALSVLRTLNQNSIPKTVVIQLGTNDSNPHTFKKAAKDIMQILGEDRRVIWANVHSNHSDKINKALREVANQHSNLDIWDFNGAVAKKKVKLSDGIHPTSYAAVAELLKDATPSAPNDSDGQSGVVDITVDANVSELLFAVLKHIGGWDKNQIIIEKLPPNLLDRIEKIYTSISSQTAESTEELSDFLKKFIGEGGYGGGSDSGGAQSATGGPENFRKAANAAAEKYGVDAAILMSIAEVESGFGKNMGPSSAGAMGPMQFMPATWKAYGLGGDIMDVEDAMMGAANYLKASGAPKNWQKAIFAYNHAQWYVDKILAGAKKYGFGKAGREGITVGEDEEDEKSSDSGRTTTRGPQGLLTQDTEKKAGGKKGSTNDDNDEDQESGEMIEASTPAEIVNRIVLPIARDCGINITVASNDAANDRHSVNTTSGNRSDHKGPREQAWATDMSNGGNPTPEMDRLAERLAKVFNIPWSGSGLVSKHTEKYRYQLIYRTNDGGNHYNHVHFGVGKVAGGTIKVDPKGSIEDAGGSTSGGGSDSTGFDDALAHSRATMVAATFNFPAAWDQAESLLFTGHKSLMNDQSLLPFIQELSMGTMRHFMSLPNGAFYAFHPDYFGGFGTKPYWEISDVEILEGNIQLSDEALATHVYVTGATTPLQNVELYNKLATHGVVHLFNAGSADFLNLPKMSDKARQKLDRDWEKMQIEFGLEDKNETKKNPKGKKPKKEEAEKEEFFDPFFGDLQTTLDFLGRYGARPLVEESTFIKSHIFETFYAFQKFMLMWSRQFLTTFTFTFMPELYPGGTVAFPSHGIQCYIDEVHHSFDYKSGFVTRANLSAPAATAENRNPISRGMIDAGRGPLGGK